MRVSSVNIAPVCGPSNLEAVSACSTQRVIALDTETTGLSWRNGHRLVEIGAVEMVGGVQTGRAFHRYFNPQRRVDPGARRVHGLTDEFLRRQAPFSQVVSEFMCFIEGATVVIHNASFDLGFLDNELRLAGKPPIGELAGEVVDTLKIARVAFPGAKNSLDALCQRFGIDNTARVRHGALVDAQLLAQTYVALTHHMACVGPAPAANMPRYALRSRDGRMGVRPTDLAP